jgi:ribonucleoside-diphosphate reductase alpha chain
MTDLTSLKASGEAPSWYTDESYATVSKGYLQSGETPKAMYRRVARSACKSGMFSDEVKHDLFYVMFDKNWLGPASPVLSNLGTDRGLPISCFGLDLDDRMEDIMGRGLGELAMLTKFGGGVGISMDRLRARGSLIKSGKNGKSEGIIPFSKVYDSAILASKQGEVRRGSASINLSIEHGDYSEFIKMRRPDGDINRQCLNLHHCVTVSDEFMHKVKNGDMSSRLKWVDLMKARIETGEPYIMFTDTINRANPESYKKHGLGVSMTNICSEIVLHTDPLHSFVCCLSSINLAAYDEWKDWKGPHSGLSLPELGIYFLNGVMDEFIDKAQYLPYMENTVRSAIKGRALGLGVMGWHTYLMDKMIPFESFKSMQANNEIFKLINEQAVKASRDLADQRGEPEWCVGTGMYNTHLIAVAPTKSNSIICGDVSAGIEPYTANAYTDVTGKGTFIRKSKHLEALLESKGQNTDKVWKLVSRNNGSVQDLDFLSAEEKEVFKTAYEINQKAIVQQAAQRQKYICQSQSLNLFFPFDCSPKYFNDVHLLAWELGVKTLYYCKSTSGIEVKQNDGDCKSCEG